MLAEAVDSSATITATGGYRRNRLLAIWGCYASYLQAAVSLKRIAPELRPHKPSAFKLLQSNVKLS